MSTQEVLGYSRHRYTVTDGIAPDEYGSADSFIGIRFDNHTGLDIHVFSPSGTEIRVPSSSPETYGGLPDISPQKTFTMKYQIRSGTDIRQGSILQSAPSNAVSAHPYKTVRLTIPFTEMLEGPFVCHDFTLVFSLPKHVDAAKTLCAFSTEFGNVAINRLAGSYFGGSVEFHREECRRYDSSEEDLTIEPVAPFLLFCNFYDKRIDKLYTEVNGNVIPIAVKHDTWRDEGVILAQPEMSHGHASTRLYTIDPTDVQSLRDGKMIELSAAGFRWKLCKRDKLVWDAINEETRDARERISAEELKYRVEEACQALKQQIEQLQREKELLEAKNRELSTELSVSKAKLRRYESADDELTGLTENQYKLQQARMKVNSDQWKYVAEQAKYNHENESREFDRRMRELEMQVKNQEASVARWKAAAAITGSVAAIAGIVAGFWLSKKKG